MSTNHHTAISTGAASDASTFNTPLGALDSAITTNAVGFANLGIVTLASDVLAATGSGAKRNIVVAAQTGTADDLIEITGLTVGDEIILRADTGDTITVKHNDAGATIKIHLLGDADTTLDEINGMRFVYIATNVVAQINNPSVASAGVWTTLVAPTTLGSTAATIDLTSISASYQDLIMIVFSRITGAVTFGDVDITVNGDTGANYNYTQDHITGGASVGANTIGGNNVNALSTAVGSSGTANFIGALYIEILDYAESGKTRNGFYRGNSTPNTTVARSSEGWFSWMNVANAINQITLTPSSGNFDVGTRYLLYGRG